MLTPPSVNFHFGHLPTARSRNRSFVRLPVLEPSVPPLIARALRNGGAQFSRNRRLRRSWHRVFLNALPSALPGYVSNALTSQTNGLTISGILWLKLGLTRFLTSWVRPLNREITDCIGKFPDCLPLLCNYLNYPLVGLQSSHLVRWRSSLSALHFPPHSLGFGFGPR